jgi:hypothetical protein
MLQVIHLPHRTDRYENLLKELSKEGITEYRIWPGIIKPEPKHGINLAFKQVVRYALEQGLSKITIAEDDICFYGNSGAWKYYWDNEPAEYDIYTGSYYPHAYHDENLKVHRFRGMTLITVHSKFYQTFLSLPDIHHIDGLLEASRADIRVSPVFVAYQMSGYSDQRKHVCTNNHKGKKVFGETPST